MTPSKSPVSKNQSTRQEKHATHCVAVIDLGTTSIRMAIGEIDDTGNVRTIETLSQEISLGKDTFTKRFIEKSTTEACVDILKSYRRRLNEYQIVQDDHIRIVATSGVREASNRLSFLDRVYSATGFEVEPIDEAEVNRVTYLGLQSLLKTRSELAQANTLVVEVGGGSTDLLLVRGEDVLYSDNFRLGSLRLSETLGTQRSSSANVRNIMEKQINRSLHQVSPHIPQDDALEMIALGGDLRFAASQLMPEWDASELAQLSLPSLKQFTDEVLSLSVDQLVQKYHLSFAHAETLGPALLAYVELANMCQLEYVLVSRVNLRDGLLKEMAAKDAWSEEFRNQIIRSALDLGRRFAFEEGHALHVANLSATLFRALQNEHQLGLRHELILYVAALLHDIGKLVNPGGHHKHSMYLINNSRLFGISRKDLLLVALVARYHRRALPKPTHEGYASLDLESRIVVAKLAAILRVADALDRSETQRIGKITCSRENGQFVISAARVDHLGLEQLALKQKGAMFDEVFGLRVLLRGIRDQTETAK